MSSRLLVSGTTAAPNMGSVTLWPPPCVPPEGPSRECDPVSPQREGPCALAVGPGAVPGQAALYVLGADSGLRVSPSSSRGSQLSLPIEHDFPSWELSPHSCRSTGDSPCSLQWLCSRECWWFRGKKPTCHRFCKAGPFRGPGCGADTRGSFIAESLCLGSDGVLENW